MENEKRGKKKTLKVLLIVLAVILLIAAAVVLFMMFRKHTVFFDSNGGSAVASKTEVTNGKELDLPEQPTRQGYIFAGWKNEEGKIVTNGVIVTDDMSLKAYWIQEGSDIVKVTYDTDGGNEIGDVISEKNQTINLPAEPTKDNYTFVGWADDSGNIILEDTKVTKPIKLKAIWIAKDSKTVSVSFYLDENTEMSNITSEDGKSIILPVNPTKEGYIFAGWLTEDGRIVAEGAVIKENTKLVARWIKKDAKTVTVTFDTDGGNEIMSIINVKGETILLPAEPIKEGFKFMGWTNEKGELLTGDIKADSNIKLKAVWVSNDAKLATISFNTNGGSAISSITNEIGKNIVLPVAPYKAGYILDAWVDASGNKVTSDTIVTENMTITATWKEAYTCPDGCTPSADGKTCTKTTTAKKVSYSGCQSGYSKVNGVCVDLSTKYYCWDGAGPGEYEWTVIEGLGAERFCAKKGSYVSGTRCPDGYKESGGTCVKTQTLNCKDNSK